MQEAKLRELANDYLLPFFSGAKIELQSRISTAKETTVAFLTPNSIAFKVDRSDNYRLVITRSQPFIQSQKNRIPELRIISDFADCIRDMTSILNSVYIDDILKGFQRRIIAKSLLSGAHESAILAGLDQLSAWGEKLYEGSAISAAIGFRNTPINDATITLQGIAQEDFGAVLSNGFDTMLVFNYSEEFLNTVVCGNQQAIPSFCPFRQGSIAEWTTQHESRIAMSLNRLGEILIFQGHQLVFARRAGRWNFLTHDPVIKQMHVPRNPAIRTSIYETCLDASFARTGACIGVVQQNTKQDWRSIISKDDQLDQLSSAKTKSISRMIAGRSFEKIDRRVRQELAAIDGATVISHTGQVLAVGAILKIRGGSTGGGRLAAAKALSAFGLGVKISQDGGITGYRPNNSDPAFRIM